MKMCSKISLTIAIVHPTKPVGASKADKNCTDESTLSSLNYEQEEDHLHLKHNLGVKTCLWATK